MNIFLLQIIPTGLAAKDGRIKKGDTIRKVSQRVDYTYKPLVKHASQNQTDNTYEFLYKHNSSQVLITTLIDLVTELGVIYVVTLLCACLVTLLVTFTSY